MDQSHQFGYSSINTARPRRRNLRKWLWATVPVWSLGLLSCVPFFARALSTKRPRDWAVTSAYLTITAAVIVMTAMGGNSSKPNAAPNALGTTAGGLALFLMAFGATHTFLLYRHPSSPLAPAPAPAINSNIAALTAAHTTVLRRAEARRIVETDPALARDLKIGRPDLQRDYDDGGLVDINHTSAEALVRALEWTPSEAQTIIDARAGIGGFSSSAELSAYTTIRPDRIDAVADLLLFRKG